MNKENIVNIHNDILFNYRKEWKLLKARVSGGRRDGKMSKNISS
jgi:hypothetical protein